MTDEIIKMGRCPNCNEKLIFSEFYQYERKGKFIKGKLVFNKKIDYIGPMEVTIVGCKYCGWGGESIENYEFDPPLKEE